MARLIVMRRGGGGKVAINPERVTHVCSAAGAFTDIFFDDQQVAIEGTFEEVVARLTTPAPAPPEPAAERRAAEGERRHDPGSGLIFGRLDR